MSRTIPKIILDRLYALVALADKHDLISEGVAIRECIGAIEREKFLDDAQATREGNQS